MKKLFFIAIFIAHAICMHAQIQLLTISPFTQIEFREGQWKHTNPITLNYALVKPISPTFYVGGGVGIGANFNEGGAITGSMPVAAFIGTQVFTGLPSIAIGGGLDALTGHPLLMLNLNFYTLPLNPTPEVKYKSIVANDAYDRNQIGFKKDKE